MVLVDEEYVHQGQQRKKTRNRLDQRAEDVAILVAQLCLGVSSDATDEGVISALNEILGTGDYRDPGELFTLGLELKAAVEDMAINIWNVFKQKGKRNS
jgi:hypothetical protein